MTSTKEQILTFLKRNGASTLESLASAFGLARMTVRQHLAALERDGLVLAREERRPAGRPRLLFSLSPRGQEAFPRRYDRLADMALQYIAVLDPDELAGLTAGEKKKLLLRKIADRTYEQHEPKVRGRPLPDRVRAVTEMLRDEGAIADNLESAGTYSIVDYNCTYGRVAESHREVCEVHVELLEKLLGAPVECAEFMSGGADACRFVVHGEAAVEPLRKD